VQLEAAKEQFVKRGLAIAAISYDKKEILQHFSNRMKITFPLLSDEGSAVIRSFGILNSEPKPGTREYGIPHPGIFIVDSSGKITAKYFEEKYQERFTPQSILALEFGELAGPKVDLKTDHLKLTTQLSQEKARPGNRVTLTADIELPKKMHVYAPGVKGYTPLNLVIEKTADVTPHAMKYPTPRIMNLEVIKERVPVYENRVRIQREFTILASARPGQMVLNGVLEYQACDDQVCYAPASVPFSFTIEIEPHDRQRVPGS